MANRKLIAGVDSSTQSVKVVIRDANTGQLLRQGRAPHPDGTQVDPAAWKTALDTALKVAGGLNGVSAISIAGQQHGMIALDGIGEVIRPAILWNDTRSAKEADDLNREAGGNAQMARKVGSVLVASFTATKLRWMADNEPENTSKVASVALPHDWLSWQLQGTRDLNKLFTDRSDASGTGYFDPTTSHYREDILRLALRHDFEIILPKIVQPNEFAGLTQTGIPIAAGLGDNAGAALGLQAQPGDVVISLGTSGTAFAVSQTATHDQSGTVAGFADATGQFLPLVCTLNAARILDAAALILGKTHEEIGSLALSSTPGAHGLTLLPYFEGERTPNRPDASGVFAGMNLRNSNPADIARAMIEGMLCGLTDAVNALVESGVIVNRILIIGGAARNSAIPVIASALLEREVILPPVGEYVADGAAKQAAWALLGDMPTWNLGKVAHHSSLPTPQVLNQYRNLRDKTAEWKK